jgi:Ca2+-binding EF-hand superfamily protein
MSRYDEDRNGRDRNGRDRDGRSSNNNDTNVPSLAIKYTIDTTLIPGESRNFAEYLCYKTLYVDVWDGASLMRVGTVAIDLRQLMRQGEPYVKSALEYDVISPFDATSTPSSATSGASQTVHARSLPAGNVVGRLQLLTSNYGVPGKGIHDEESDRKAAMSGRSPSSTNGTNGSPNAPQSTANSSNGGDWRLGVPPSKANVGDGARHRVRARPLTSSNPELRALIKSRHQAYDLGESRARQKQRKEEWSSDMKDVRALTDASTISTTELDLILQRYRGSRPSTIKWRDFLASFTGLKPGSKSRNTNTPKKNAPAHRRRSAGGEAINPLERQLRKILNAAKKKGLKLNDSFAHFDANGSGKVSRKQFRDALRKLGFQASDNDMNFLMTRFDKDGDGEITITEFAEFATAPDVDGKMSAAEKKLHKILESAHKQGLDYEEAFVSFDRDGDGQISKKEFSRAIRDIFSPTKINLDENEVTVLVRRFDLNNNGYITMTDFLRFARGTKGKSELATELRKILTHSEQVKGLSLKKAFRAFDKDGSGEIAKEEFEQMLRNLGFHPTMNEINTLFAIMDKDNSGRVELKEFQKWVRNESRSEKTSEESAMWRTAGTTTGQGDDGNGASLPNVPIQLEEVQIKINNAITNASKESSTFDIVALFEQFDRRMHNEITTQEFKYILMDLKLSLLEGDEIEIQKEETKKRAERMSRQLARIEAYSGNKNNDNNRRGNTKRNDDNMDALPSDGSQIGKAQQLQKLYKLKTEDLQLVRRYRESRKR